MLICDICCGYPARVEFRSHIKSENVARNLESCEKLFAFNPVENRTIQLTT